MPLQSDYQGFRAGDVDAHRDVLIVDRDEADIVTGLRAHVVRYEPTLSRLIIVSISAQSLRLVDLPEMVRP